MMKATRLATLGAAGLLLAAMPAGATVFSFGTIDATDVITSIQLAANDGSGGQTFNFNTATNTLTITSSVTQINFANQGPISGIPIGDVIFSSQLQLSGSFSFVAPVTPIQTSGTFTNGLTDFTIWDVAGGAVSVLEGDFISGLLVTFMAQGGVIRGELSGEYNITGGDADAQAAFGSAGLVDELIPTAFTGLNLCNKVVVCSGPGGTSGLATDWKTFQANPTSTLIPTPEPSVALLLLAAAPIVARLRRR